MPRTYLRFGKNRTVVTELHGTPRTAPKLSSWNPALLEVENK
ncbi:hypothetical protein PV963_07405 [Streptomyces coeruleorubidus]|nr:hypothetical protein [Streptomyces coeruleorubidus]WDV50201.1 hypothetical protein PV963_07405 [Streptomyces coeruleorubidus]